MRRPRRSRPLASLQLELNHGNAYDARDESFVVVQRGDPEAEIHEITVVQNWLSEFEEN